MNFEGFPNINDKEDEPIIKLESNYPTKDKHHSVPQMPQMSRRGVLKEFGNLLMGGSFAGGVLIGKLDKERKLNNKTNKQEPDVEAVLEFEPETWVDSNSEVFEQPVEVVEEKNEALESTEPVIVEEEVVESTQTNEDVETSEVSENRLEISSAELKNIKPELTYKENISAPVFENLNMPDKVGRFGATSLNGKILRTLRFKNITDAVETRYNLPKNVIMSIMMQESTGVDLLPNAKGDGGFGLCHMQGSSASEFGLKTFCGCNSLVCDSKRGCKDENGDQTNHAAKLLEIMKESPDDKKLLVESDERLHWILNIDAVGRMLASHISGKKIQGLGPFRTSIARYAGIKNFKKDYWTNICSNMLNLDNESKLDEVADFFNSANPDFKIDGKKADFYGYIVASQSQAENYGLEEYKKLQKYNPKNSEGVLSSYKDYLA